MSNGNGYIRTTFGNFFRFLARTIDSYRPRPSEIVIEFTGNVDELAEQIRQAKARHERLNGPGSW